MDDEYITLPRLNKSRPSLYKTIKAIVPRLGQQEFESAHILMILENQGVKIKGTKTQKKQPISKSLRKLVVEKVIEQTFEGAGCHPHWYKYLKQSKKYTRKP